MTTYTIKPGDSGSTTEGSTQRDSVNQTFAAIRAGAGNFSASTGSIVSILGLLQGSATLNQFATLTRWIGTFNTASVPAGAIASAKLMFTQSDVAANDIGLGTSTTIEIVAATPAANNTVADADYQQLGSVSFGSIALTDVPNVRGAAFEIPLNASGVAAITAGGTTRLGARLGWDLTGTFTGTWVSGNYTSVRINGEAATASAKDPVLVIVTLDAPTNTLAPKITSSAATGFTTGVTTGTWTDSPTSYAYQWRLETTAGSGTYADIGGATSSNYTVVTGDAGKRLYCVVTATNVTGSTNADSNISAAIVAMPTNIIEAF